MRSKSDTNCKGKKITKYAKKSQYNFKTLHKQSEKIKNEFMVISQNVKVTSQKFLSQKLM